MNNNALMIRVTVHRRSIFPKVVTPNMIMLEGMKSGGVINGRFRPGENGQSFTIAYRPERIGRGIQIRWDEKDVRFTELCLNLPSSEEELDDFFRMSARLARQDISEVLINDKPFLPKEFHTIREGYRVYNLKLLHEMMGNVLNEPPGRISIGCVFHRLVAGEKEADRMWAGVDASVFRDWMHESQALDAYFSEARVEENDNAQEYRAVFPMPSGTTVILPDHEELPIRFYDLETGRPRYTISEWLVELVDESTRSVIGQLPLGEFRSRLPQDKISYFDAADSLLKPFTVEELQLLLGQADQEHA